MNSNTLGYVLDGEHKEAQLCSLFKGAEKSAAIPVELFEFFGTIRFINLFRRDEIKFVHHDDESHCSIHYSLSDFATAGANGVRKIEDYMKNYFVDRYGASKNSEE